MKLLPLMFVTLRFPVAEVASVTVQKYLVPDVKGDEMPVIVTVLGLANTRTALPENTYGGRFAGKRFPPLQFAKTEVARSLPNTPISGAPLLYVVSAVLSTVSGSPVDTGI